MYKSEYFPQQIRELTASPRKGYRSITVPDDVFDYFTAWWEREKESYRLQGVRSFSGYVSRRLKELMEQEKTRSGGRGTGQRRARAPAP
jgi:hypothetical protein